MEARFIENVPNARILRNKLDFGKGVFTNISLKEQFY